MSDSVRPHRRQPTRLPRPWDSPGKNTGVGCHFLLQCMKVKVKSLSRVQLLATPWTAAHQAPPSMGFSRQEYWSGVPLPSPGLILVDPSSHQLCPLKKLTPHFWAQGLLFAFFHLPHCTGSSLLCKFFSSRGEQGLLSSHGTRTSHCGSFSCCGARALGQVGSVVVAHGLHCPRACGIFLDQGSNPCPLHWQADSYPLEQQGSPLLFLYEVTTGLWVAHNRGTAFTRVYYLLTTTLRVCWYKILIKKLLQAVYIIIPLSPFYTETAVDGVETFEKWAAEPTFKLGIFWLQHFSSLPVLQCFSELKKEYYVLPLHRAWIGQLLCRLNTVDFVEHVGSVTVCSAVAVQSLRCSTNTQHGCVLI